MRHAFGLSSLPPQVVQALASTYGHHRTPWFEGILKEIGERLRPSLGDQYTPLFLTCTGLGGREAVVANLVRPSDHVLATPGDFSALARAWGASVTEIPAPADAAAPDAVLIQHVLTPGTVVDAEGVIAAARRAAPAAPVVLDASISLGVDIGDLRALEVDAVIVTPERGLMGIPGLAIVGVTDAFVELLGRRRPTLVERPFLFDLLKHHRAWSKGTTPFSPNISACVALQAALRLIDESGGLPALHETHRLRAEEIREALADRGLAGIAPVARMTNAWTTFDLPEGVDGIAAAGALRSEGIDARVVELNRHRVEIAHAGYLPKSRVGRLGEVLARIVEARPAAALSTPVSMEEPVVVRAPFSIAPREFVEQADRHAAATNNPRVQSHVARAARRIFRDEHAVHEEALRHRVIGFVGAGRIVANAVELCRARGVQHLMVFSPSLAAAHEDSPALAEWKSQGVGVAPTLEHLFEECHAVVLLPVVYDDAALALFRKPAHYRNHGLLSAALLERAERAGRLDLVINAAARGALVDRAALADAVGQGWLRYLSDETPSATDPLLEYDNAAFTAHVGGSCRAPQAAVARNTHTILRRILAEMRGLTTDDADGYRVNVVNGHLLDESAGRRLQTAARDIGESGRVRVLLTDSFDVESLAFGSLASMGIEADVHDISAGPMSSAKLVDAVERLRPHVLMLRSRTRIDAAAAERLAGIGELACIIRPGVGVDNVYAGMSALSAAGVRIVNEPFGNSRAVAEMALHFLLSGTETTLLAPGPTKFNSEVFDVAHAYDEVRIQEPGRPEAAIGRTLGRWLGARRAALTISGPGTALMEASIANLTRAGDRGLVISHGKFGDRFAEIAAARGRPCEILKIEEEDWGRAVTPHDVERALMQDADRCSGTAQPPISFLCFQQNETSSGVTYHEPAIRALVRVARTYHPDMIVIADAISGALAHRLTFDALDLDALFLGSQKALAVSSGLAFAVLSDRAVKTMLTRAGFAGDLEAFCGDADAALCLERFDRLQHVHSTNLLRAIHTASRGGSDDTPSLLHLLQTERALELFEEEGGAEALAGRHSELAHLVRDGVRRLGLELMPSAPYESDSVTVAILPPGLEASAIRKAVARNTGIAIAGAQGDFWKPRMLRIGTLGFVTRADAVRCLRALGVALEAAGHKGAVRDRALATAR